MRIRLIQFVVLLLILGCEDEKKFKPVYQVPADLESYLTTFLKEASSRGLNYTIDNLIVKHDETLTEPVCGTCNDASASPNIQKIILIKSNSVCWTNEEQLENLIFHELGHCFLHRQHLSDTLPNGDPKSIMFPENNSLYSSCIYDINGGPCNQTFKRKYYIDELFDEGTQVPDWAK